MTLKLSSHDVEDLMCLIKVFLLIEGTQTNDFGTCMVSQASHNAVHHNATAENEATATSSPYLLSSSSKCKFISIYIQYKL